MKRRIQSLEEFKESQKPIDYSSYVSEETNDIDEKSVSVAQQRLFGMAWAVRSGAMKRDDVPQSVLGIVDSNMTDDQIKDFAKTSHTGLPNKVEKTNEEAVKHKSDLEFMNKVVDHLKKANWRVWWEPINGTLIITGKDDEKVKFEYYY